MFTLYHNPGCGKSRKMYNLIKLSGNDFQTVQYLKNPLGEEEITQILKELSLPISGIIRKKETLYKEKYEGKKFSDKKWISILAQNPVLIERPILRSPEKTILVREQENEEAFYRLLFPRLNQLYLYLKMDETDSFSLYSIAYEYMMLKDWELAIVYFERLRAIHPDYTGLYYHLGKIYEKKGEMEEGMTIFMTGIREAEQKNDLHALSELKNLVQNRKMGIYDED